MATIEERAYRYAVKTDKPYSWFCDLEKSYIVGATEQDRIARQEERERCINIACEVYCRDCGCCYSEQMRLEKKQNNCSMLDELRKAMEGGEQWKR